jgi:hypothetical protein
MLKHNTHDVHRLLFTNIQYEISVCRRLFTHAGSCPGTAHANRRVNISARSAAIVIIVPI